MANTYVDYTATAGQTDFNFSFPYLQDDHVEVLKDGTEETGFTIALSPTRIVLNVAATGGEAIRIRRSSDPTVNLVDFENGSVLTENELDLAYRHNRYLNEEAFEGNTSSLQTAAGSSNFDANFNKIINLAPPTSSLDAANKDYVDDKLVVSGTSLSGFNKSTHTGDNATTAFTLSFTAQTGTAAAFRVAIDGVLQTPDDAYTINTGTNQITFTSAPPTNAEIVVIATGTAQDVNSIGVTATGSTTARTLADRFADRICVFDFMSDAEITAVRNRDYSSITDVTTSVQSALDDPDVKKLYFPEGLYYCDNLTIPNKTLDILGAGHEITDIIAITGLTDTNYFVASSNYVSNSTSAGNSPLKVSGLNFNGAGVADNTFVLYGYSSVLQDSSFKDSASGGFSLVISDTTKDGTICSSTLVENKINNCIIRGAGGGGAFRVTAGQKVTDGRLSNCIVFDGRTLCQTLAGWNISNNHFYGSGAVIFRKASQGTVIHGNYFESSVNMEDFIEEVVQMSSNAHTSTLTASFGTSGFKLIVDNPYFTGAGIVSHDFFSDAREIIINGGSFGTGVSAFTNWTNGSSTGKIKLNRVYAYADGLLLSGVGNALTNDYSEDFLSNTANTSSSFTPLTWQTTSSGGPTANYTWVKRIGRYIKVGKQVTVWFYHEWTSTSLGTGLSEVGILPEASANVTDLEFSGVISKISSTATADQFTLHIPPNSTALRVKKKTSGSATTDLDRSDWTIGTNYIAGQITYLID